MLFADCLQKKLYAVKEIVLCHCIYHTRPFYIKGLQSQSLFFCYLALLQWRHNDRDVVSNHQPHDCLLNCLFRHTSKKTSKLCVTGLGIHRSPVNSPHKGPVTRKIMCSATNPYLIQQWTSATNRYLIKQWTQQTFAVVKLQWSADHWFSIKCENCKRL